MSVETRSPWNVKLTEVLELIVSATRQEGSTHSALRRAAERITRTHDCICTVSDGTARVTTRSGRTGYVFCHQTRIANQYRFVVRTETDGSAEDVAAVADRVLWQLLPPGRHPFETVLEHILAVSQMHPAIRFDQTRLQRLHALGPTSIAVGVDEFVGYFVFVFEDRSTAVLECPRVGNAVYILRGLDWEALSRLSKRELLSRRDAKRIVHAGDWFNKVATCLKQRPPRETRHRGAPSATSNRSTANSWNRRP